MALAGFPVVSETRSGRLALCGSFVALELRLDVRGHDLQPKQVLWVSSEWWDPQDVTTQCGLGSEGEQEASDGGEQKGSYCLEGLLRDLGEWPKVLEPQFPYPCYGCILVCSTGVVGRIN